MCSVEWRRWKGNGGWRKRDKRMQDDEGEGGGWEVRKGEGCEGVRARMAAWDEDVDETHADMRGILRRGIGRR
jgi:hypothetical protein